MPTSPFQTDFAHTIYKARYAHPGEEWPQTAARVTKHVLGALNEAPRGYRVAASDPADERIFNLINERKFMPGGRYLYAAGRPLHQVQNCLLLKAEDSREGWAELQYNATMALMTGAGIGVWYGDIREADAIITKTGGVASGPIPLMNMTNETGRNVMQGGARRSAIWAGLPWWHPDVEDFIRAKDWPEWLREQKALDYNVPAPLDMTNISVTLDDAFFAAYENPQDPDHDRAVRIYRKVVDKMVTTGEPGFSVDRGDKADEVLRNACTEVTSADDSDVCNLGSLVITRFESPMEFGAAVRDAILFLTAGSLYSDLPYTKVYDIREKNRRLGLGIMDIGSFCARAGVKYGSPESFELLEPYMREYEKATEYAWEWQDALRISRSIATRAIAPTGTIAIVAEVTGGGEPIFSAAEKRRVRHAGPKGDEYQTTVVVDPIAKKLVSEGVDPSQIEDAGTLALMPERRFAMQEFLQRYTDQGISSTVNLPAPIKEDSEQAAFGDLLMKYLPNLRGITTYPDGARSGQPKTPVDLAWALEREGTVVETDEESCANGVCGI